MTQEVRVFFNDFSKLNINPNEKCAVYFHGCFCPPHRGHIETIDLILNNIKNNNLKLLVNQIGSTRHGVSRETNYYIMKTYLKELYSHLEYKHFKDKDRDKILNDHNLSGINTIIIAKGIEKEDENNFNCPVVRNKLIHSNNDKYRYLTKKYNVIVIYTKRGIYSATKFSKTLIEYKRKHNNYDKCLEFLPNISHHEKKNIMNKLLETKWFKADK
jgi:hypothetical protein